MVDRGPRRVNGGSRHVVVGQGGQLRRDGVMNFMVPPEVNSALIYAGWAGPDTGGGGVGWAGHRREDGGSLVFVC